MCATCGCGDPNGTRITDLDHDHEHGHPHDHAHSVTVSLEQRVLAKNDRLAEGNRAWLAERDILAVNLMSSPGAGKTTLLERTARALAGELPVSVIEGDQETLFDAERIRAAGCRAVQVNTGAGCHLDAQMLAGALRALAPADRSVVLIENVGNLVCPALFDLGERARVVITSVTEGADKPLKYPHMFRSADLVVLNKIDLLPYVDFDVARFTSAVRTVCPSAVLRHTSATTGDGVDEWLGWLRGLSAAGAVV
jgi:hydrogenase nickel incorporation protein HypB